MHDQLNKNCKSVTYIVLHCCKSLKFIGKNVTKKLTEILEHIMSDLSLIFQRSNSWFRF